ncbi:MAG: NADP-dependent phosphogluconate dehydrogenase [Planctomycetota bacterium]|nr:NADP-dependent phosphogluconate dehydrogenase [Planctomycetota bacterium]
MAEPCRIGIVGLGTMGRNFVLNMADHGFRVAGLDKDPEKVAALLREAAGRPVLAVENAEPFVAALAVPRAVMLLVPAGKAVDAVTGELAPLLTQGDVIIDGGNSYYADTERRTKALAERGLQFLGVGISGGESGARRGPSIMPGGSREAYERVRPIFEACAAQVGGEPCVTWLGPGAAGHYVKMVHNGIEYGLLQLIAESYDLMRRGLGFGDEQLHGVYDRWNRGELSGYLMEITARIFRQMDDRTDKHLIDVILDEAAQKGTGMWTSESAMEAQVPVPTIDTAVGMRGLSGDKTQREAQSKLLSGPPPAYAGDPQRFVDQLGRALYAAWVLTYAQGLALLAVGSRRLQYGLDLEAVARIWRGGCIIRSALLEDIRRAYHARPDLPNLLQDPHLAQIVISQQDGLRAVACAAAGQGIPAPALMSALGYYDSYRSAWLPANLIQAERDYFGAHTYQRLDAKGTFHTHWDGD